MGRREGGITKRKNVKRRMREQKGRRDNKRRMREQKGGRDNKKEECKKEDERA
jgi:hypothetical protein